MTSAIGRLVTDVQTNKSGGAVAYGDVVVNDGSNAHAFTTTTTAAFTTGVVGVCIEPNGIASNATGRIQYQGYCAQVNTNASVTNGYFLKTHTVAKQAAGSSTRVVGSFGVAMSTATNPAALLWGFPDATSATGNVATDAIWDAKGDLAAGTGADTAAKLTAGSNGMVPVYDSSQSQGLKTAYPPGYEFDRVTVTSVVTINGASEGAATTVVTGGGVAYDGATVVDIEVFLQTFYGPATAANDIIAILLEDSTVLGQLGSIRSESTNRGVGTLFARVRRTPSNASHTYTVKAWVTIGAGGAGGGAGGSGTALPGYVRVVKA